MDGLSITDENSLQNLYSLVAVRYNLVLFFFFFSSVWFLPIFLVSVVFLYSFCFFSFHFFLYIKTSLKHKFEWSGWRIGENKMKWNFWRHCKAKVTMMVMASEMRSTFCCGIRRKKNYFLRSIRFFLLHKITVIYICRSQS